MPDDPPSKDNDSLDNIEDDDDNNKAIPGPRVLAYVKLAKKICELLNFSCFLCSEQVC